MCVIYKYFYTDFWQTRQIDENKNAIKLLESRVNVLEASLKDVDVYIKELDKKLASIKKQPTKEEPTNSPPDFATKIVRQFHRFIHGFCRFIG